MEFLDIRQDGVAIAVELLPQSVLSDMDWVVKKFDVLSDLELDGRGEATIAYFGSVDF